MRPLSVAVAFAAVPSLIAAKHAEPKLQNANHIFNAIHKSMRQFGSSLNHNGMSVFVATVSEDTELYHGTSNPYRVNGTEWLAFEPEHALIFARGGRGPPGKGRGPPGGPPPGPDRWEAHYRGELPEPHRGPMGGSRPPPPMAFGDEDRREDLRRDVKAQKPLDVVAAEKPALTGDAEEPHGYLHTYRTKHALRLMYVDGQSAAKSDKGTLDTQDLVLLHHDPPQSNEPGPPIDDEHRVHTSEDQEQRGKRRRDERSRHHGPRDELKRPGPAADDEPERPHHGPMGEFERAQGMCELARQEYDGRVDGILRMESGFEIILCDFAAHLDVVSIAQAKTGDMGPGGPGKDGGDGFNYYRAVAARYDSIGGGRVEVDYSNFVTLFAHPKAMYFDDTGRARVKNDTDLIEPIREAIKELALSSHDPSALTYDWQTVADLVIGRYADRIDILATASHFTDLKEFKAEVDRALRPFINYGDRNKSAEIGRCAKQFLPSAYEHSVAPAAISDVSNIICRTLSGAAETDTLAYGLSMMRALKSWLGWTTWKRCRGCGPDEICFLPIWPVGSQEDFEQPKCRSDMSEAPHGYWGGFGGRPNDGKGGRGMHED